MECEWGLSLYLHLWLCDSLYLIMVPMMMARRSLNWKVLSTDNTSHYYEGMICMAKVSWNLVYL